MAKLLHLIASPRGEKSKSSKIALARIDAMQSQDAELHVDTSALSREPLPEFDGIVRRAIGSDGPHPPSCLWLAIFMAVWFTPVWCSAQATEPTVIQRTHYLTTRVDGLTIFYREAGPKDAPTLLLLHGFPSSSRMFEPLLSRLADRYHLVAPDYPGFGLSDAPNPKAFAYSFEHLATVMSHFVDQVGLRHYTLYMQDYGGPVGFRMALAHPERVDALIVQNAVAHETGLGARWTPLRAFWADRARHEAAFRANFLSLKTTQARHLGSDPNPDRYDPDLWIDEDAFLSRPGEADIQTDLFYDYQTNVAAYPTWQAWLKQKHPRLLVVWGKYDPSFDLSEPQAFKRDVPDAEVHLLEAGHFALDTAAEPIATIIRGFMHDGMKEP